MSIGSGIFLSTLLVVCVFLSRWLFKRSTPKVIFKKLLIWGSGGIIFVGIVVSGLWGYNYYSNLPTKQTSYYGVSLGMSKSEVQYVLGQPIHVIGESDWESASNSNLYLNWSNALVDYLLKQAVELKGETPNSFRAKYSQLSDKENISNLHRLFYRKHPAYKFGIDAIDIKFTKDAYVFINTDVGSDFTVYESPEVIKSSEIPTGKKIIDYGEWEYEFANIKHRLYVSFDKNSNKTNKIRCYTDEGRGDCEPIFGITPGTSEDVVFNKLGKPTSEKIDGITKTIYYENLNFQIYLTKKIVYMMEIVSADIKPTHQ